MGMAAAGPQGPDALPETMTGALQHVARRGSLLQLVGDRFDRLELTKSLIDRGLIAWNKAGGLYELTAAGRGHLDQRPKIAAVRR
jgi:hypothetical protein